MVNFDFSEIDRLAADLGEVPKKAGPLIRKAVEVTSVKVKKAWQEPLRGGGGSLRGLPGALSYDITGGSFFGVSVIKSEIGFDRDKFQGPLGGVSEYGTPTIAGRGYGLTALEANQADFEKGLGLAGTDALKEVGL